MTGGAGHMVTSAAAPGQGFGLHDVVASWEYAAARAGRRRRLTLLVLLGILAMVAAMLLGLLPRVVEVVQGVSVSLFFLFQRLLQWQHDDLVAELKRQGAPFPVLEATTVFFGSPAVRTPRDLDDYLRLLKLVGADPVVFGEADPLELPGGDD